MNVLSDYATVKLGQKTLLNDFFHLDDDRISQFGIEDAYVEPLYTLKDLDAGSYNQNGRSSTWVLQCTAAPADLRGTGAQKYIEWGATQTVGGKKQAGGTVVRWPETENMRSKQHWYWPSQSLVVGRIALRKGIGRIYAPFLFDEGVAFDQRLYVVTDSSIDEAVLAAYLCSSAFALALEASADLGLGGGVLSLGTRALRSVAVGRLEFLENESHRVEILDAARALYRGRPPTAEEYPTNDALRRLDRAILRALGLDPDRAQELEFEVAGLAAARSTIQQSRKKSVTESADVNIASVATAVSKRLGAWLGPRRWPEDVSVHQAGHSFAFPPGHLVADVSNMLGQCELTIRDAGGSVHLRDEFPELVAEVIVRALQLGRRSFRVAADDADALRSLDALLEIVEELEDEFFEAMAASGVGQRYEGEVKRRALAEVDVDLTGLRRPFDSGSWDIAPW